MLNTYVIKKVFNILSIFKKKIKKIVKDDLSTQKFSHILLIPAYNNAHGYNSAITYNLSL